MNDIRKNNNGFTLIELLISIAIVGILIAIAIPIFGVFRERAYNASAMSHINIIRTAEEGWFTSNFTYIAVIPAEGPGPTGPFPSQNAPAGVGYQVGLPNTTGFVSYTGHNKGTRVFANSIAGGSELRMLRLKQTANASTEAQALPTAAFLIPAWGSKI